MFLPLKSIYNLLTIFDSFLEIQKTAPLWFVALEISLVYAVLKRFQTSAKISTIDNQKSHKEEVMESTKEELKLNSIFSIEISFFEEIFFLPFFASFCESNPDLEYISLGVDAHWD